ncbi:MAG: UPF0182 family protein [Thermomicrobiales bacterium]|nr:UPF0182 family protein [Thermomicrobiales bacterium]
MFKGFSGGSTRPSGPQNARQVRPPLRRPSVTISASTKRMIVTAAIIFGLIILLFATAAFWVQWWWFGSMGYRSLLVTRYLSEISVFVVAAAITGSVFLGNVAIALRRSRRATPKTGRLTTLTDRFVFYLGMTTGLVAAILFGLTAASNWETWLLWWNSEPFGYDDPVFGRDIGFFIFALPALWQAVDLLLLLTLLTLVAVVVVYALRLGIDFRRIKHAPSVMRVHVLAIAGFVFVLLALRHVLSNYELAYSTRGAVFGASYTDVTVQRPANWALAIAALLIGGALVSNAFVQRVRLLIGAMALWGVLYLLLGVFLPSAVQQTVVEPSELNKEREFIDNHIAMTRSAYGLDAVDTRELTGQEILTSDALSANPETIDNVRLWDYRVIRGTFQQLESFVPYYVFLDVDVDRYMIDGGFQQVLISARELDQSGLPATAQTWTNQRLVYTHGYGLVVSPVSGVVSPGLPSFLVQRIPPTGDGIYIIERPEIYFGEADLDWVVVQSGQPEFSGLIDTDNPTSGPGYAGLGKGSIQMSNYLKKVLLAANLGDRNLLLSGNITSESDVLLHRNISDRIKLIAPFLQLDPDPYLIIADGRLVWVVDAYTSSDLFPHAERTGGVNYIRNSVKVTVDAYDGTVTFYRTNQADPIADAYGSLYDDLFTPIDQAPPSVAMHFRYPEHLFDIQSDVYASVHVTDATAFYNGEDRWTIPQEQVDNVAQRMEPYYVTMTLPGESSSDFALIRPFIPGGRSQRQNMTAWMAGRIGADGANQLVVYRFPRQETIFGPAQVEARINQEPEISAQIALWNQSGSRVVRGNLLVIPIGESVLYVQPLYLQASQSTGALPELKRVIVASNDRVVMNETLDGALAELTGREVETPAGGDEPGGAETPGLEDATVQSLVEQAVDAYNRGEQALAAGDWAAYGAAQTELEIILAELARVTNAPVEVVGAATPAATPVAGE